MDALSRFKGTPSTAGERVLSMMRRFAFVDPAMEIVSMDNLCARDRHAAMCFIKRLLRGTCSLAMNVKAEEGNIKSGSNNFKTIRTDILYLGHSRLPTMGR